MQTEIDGSSEKDERVKEKLKQKRKCKFLSEREDTRSEKYERLRKAEKENREMENEEI